MVAVAVVLVRKSKNFRRAEIDAVPTPLTSVPVNEYSSSKFAGSETFGNFGHLDFLSRSFFLNLNTELAGSNCLSFLALSTA